MVMDRAFIPNDENANFPLSKGGIFFTVIFG
jgi:hypothetical protein